MIGESDGRGMGEEALLLASESRFGTLFFRRPRPANRLDFFRGASECCEEEGPVLRREEDREVDEATWLPLRDRLLLFRPDLNDPR
jgi:hypothetical protein